MFKIGLPSLQILSKTNRFHTVKNGVKDPPHDSANFLIMRRSVKSLKQKRCIFVKLRQIEIEIGPQKTGCFRGNF